MGKPFGTAPDRRYDQRYDDPDEAGFGSARTFVDLWNIMLPARNARRPGIAKTDKAVQVVHGVRSVSPFRPNGNERLQIVRFIHKYGRLVGNTNLRFLIEHQLEQLRTPKITAKPKSLPYRIHSGMGFGTCIRTRLCNNTHFLQWNFMFYQQTEWA